MLVAYKYKSLRASGPCEGRLRSGGSRIAAGEGANHGEREPITGVLGRNPQRCPGAELKAFCSFSYKRGIKS